MNGRHEVLGAPRGQDEDPLVEAVDTEDVISTQAPSELAAPLASETRASAAASDAEMELVGRVRDRSDSIGDLEHLQGEINKKVVPNLIMKKLHNAKVLINNSSSSQAWVITLFKYVQHQAEISEDDWPPFWRAIEKETSSMIDKNVAMTHFVLKNHLKYVQPCQNAFC